MKAAIRQALAQAELPRAPQPKPPRVNFPPARGHVATRVAIAGIAPVSCRRCHGYGMRWGVGRDIVCECVYRRIFRQCIQRARAALAFPTVCGPVGIEYAADVEAAGRRELNARDWAIFHARLYGISQPACCRALGIDEGTYWHCTYAIEEHLGQVFAELLPYPLYPDYAYFQGCRHETADPPRRALAQAAIIANLHKTWGMGYVSHRESA